MSVDRRAFDPGTGVYRVSGVCGPERVHARKAHTHADRKVTRAHQRTCTLTACAASQAPSRRNFSAHVAGCTSGRSLAERCQRRLSPFAASDSLTRTAHEPCVRPQNALVKRSRSRVAPRQVCVCVWGGVHSGTSY